MLCAPLALAACNTTPPSAPTGLTMTGTGNGIAVAQPNDGRAIAFGSSQQGTLDTIREIIGVQPRQIPCGVETRDAFITPQGMVTIFEGGKFVGWRRITTTGGARCH
ncbi:hypothetical protein [Jannaschia formosa]|uniref:hypothetical protein n=1 Tax=Jannaschia formosa TaxID=2259592 RepID=UPI000E1BB3E4|nr:hypothetical protein [Jannaschia formosa]TFL20142.1 hypothetical protein DR046_01990 [Jannaschia formosa]